MAKEHVRQTNVSAKLEITCWEVNPFQECSLHLTLVQSLLLIIRTLILNIKTYYNRTSKFVSSNSIAQACFIFPLCTLMTSANISLQKKIFHWVENVIKQLVHTSAVRSSRYEALGKFGEHSRS